MLALGKLGPPRHSRASLTDKGERREEQVLQVEQHQRRLVAEAIESRVLPVLHLRQARKVKQRRVHENFKDTPSYA